VGLSIDLIAIVSSSSRMNSNAALPEPYYIAYIDEAGDPGLTKVRPFDLDGASEWLTLGAVVIRSRVEPQVVEWVRSIRSNIKDTQGPDLHFRTLSDHRKQRVCEMVSEMALRGFVVVSHKPNMKGWKNAAAEAVSIGSRGWFYNWCIRLLLERVTDACATASIREYGEAKPIKVVFSQRGGVKYNWLRVYIELLIIQAKNGTTVLQKRTIRHETLHPKLVEVVPSKNSAGCQLADVITSAFHSAADARGRRWNTIPAEKLASCMAQAAGIRANYSVALQPTPAWRAGRVLTADQKKIFECYGYDFR
jgi:Protein of unknown function (DUF3800)